MRSPALFIAICAICVLRPAIAITIDSSQSVGAVPGVAVSGLSGSFYKLNTTGNVSSIAQATQLISASAGPDATFTTNTICFPDCASTLVSDTTSLAGLLNGNVDNFSYRDPSAPADQIDHTAMVLSGYIEVTHAGSYTYYLGSADGSMLSVAGQNVISNDGHHSFSTDSATVTFTAAGIYAVSILYFENTGPGALDFYVRDNATKKCIVGRSGDCKSSTAASDLLLSTSAIPEPSSLWVYGVGLLGLVGFFVYRRRRAGLARARI